MKCPVCESPFSQTIDSRDDGNVRRRRKRCKNCKHKWSTIEVNILRQRSASVKELKLEYRRQVLGLAKKEIRAALEPAIEQALAGITED